MNKRMNKILTLDSESTIKNDGNPFTESNRLMCVGTLLDGDLTYFDVEHSGQPYVQSLRSIRALVEATPLLVGFNIKYDLHWLRRYIPDIKFPPVWDCQLAEFILSNQTKIMPSMAWTCTHYGLPDKYDLIEANYWSQGIDTDQVPLPILKERVLQDVERTYEIYLQQLPKLTEQGKLSLFRLQCEDLLVLQEMEYNGMLFDHTESLRKGVECEAELERLTAELVALVPDAVVNWNSNDHLSAVLYGGFINQRAKVPVLKQRKSGEVWTELWGYKQIQFPRLVDPLPGTECVDTKDMQDDDIERINRRKQAERKPLLQRIYHTNENVLRSLGATGKAKRIVELVLGYAEQDKLRNTYYLGIPKLAAEMGWGGSVLHGQFNQSIARTGRLSSSKPNLQNFSGAIKPLFTSRFSNDTGFTYEEILGRS